MCQQRIATAVCLVRTSRANAPALASVDNATTGLQQSTPGINFGVQLVTHSAGSELPCTGIRPNSGLLMALRYLHWHQSTAMTVRRTIIAKFRHLSSPSRNTLRRGNSLPARCFIRWATLILPAAYIRAAVLFTITAGYDPLLLAIGIPIPAWLCRSKEVRYRIDYAHSVYPEAKFNRRLDKAGRKRRHPCCWPLNASANSR